MDNLILIRFGEIFLKGNNKYYFESLLKKNIKSSLKGLDYKFSFSQNRYYISDYQDNDEGLILEKLSKIFGIYSYSKCKKVVNDIDALENLIKESYIPKNGSFRFTVNRAYKKYPLNSMQLSKRLGGVVLEQNEGLKVDLFTPNTEIFVDIRENGYTYVYDNVELCAMGMPVGCSGRGLLMLSGGIDSPVAGYMMAKRGMKIECIHFHSFPYTSERALDKVFKLKNIMQDYCLEMNIYVVPFTKIQEEIHAKCPSEFMITLMRRFMMRIAQKIALREGLQAIITGESLGQVASQTIESITSSNSVVSIPVLRPLIGNDKQEIVEISKKINTYDTSILPYEDCCTVFLPKFPIIKPKLAEVEKLELALDIEALIKEAIEGTECKYLFQGNNE